MNPSQQLQHLVDLNINTVKFEPAKMLTNELSTKLVSWRKITNMKSTVLL